MDDDLLFREETETVRKAKDLLESGKGDAAEWMARCEWLLSHYEKLLSQTMRITRISDRFQQQVWNLHDRLVAANSYQRQLLDTAITGIIEVDSSRTIIAANQAFCSATGYSQEELTGTSFADIFIKPEDAASQSLDCCPPFPVCGFECVARTKDGRLLNVLGNSTARKDAAGRITGGIVSVVDVTDLVIAREAAKSADQAKSAFIATMSHEIRTPLNGILGMIELLGQSDLTDQQQKKVAIMHSAAESLVRLLNDVLDLAKIESGKLALEETDFSLQESLSECTSLMRIRAANKGLAFNISYSKGIPDPLRGDPARLRQILFNLLDNAIKFTEHGTIDVLVQAIRQKNEKVLLHFSVSDTGIGIEPGKEASIFERFSQADSSMTRRYGGSGLGLAVVSELTSAMNGAIWVDSAPGEGSTFHFTVRCGIRYNGSEDSPSCLAEEDRHSLRGMRVLLAEDHPLNQMVVREALRSYGCDLYVVSSGREAVEALGRHPYDVVLMDLQMPGMDGLEATKRIRSDERFATIPIIALTAHSTQSDREQCLAVGMNDYLSKPLRVDQLISVLRIWGQGRAASPNQAAMETIAEGERPGRVRSDFSGIDVDSALERLDGNEQLFCELLEEFCASCCNSTESILAAWQTGDFPEARRLIHSIKGVAGNLSATDLYSAAGNLERLVSEGDEESFLAELDRFSRALQVILRCTGKGEYQA
ncbi:MAG: response regulator [Thermodesulfobacteriota bacterium]